MSNATSKFTSVLVAIALVGGAWFFIRAAMNPGAQPQFATVLQSPLELPDFSLINQEGESFTRESLEHNWNLLFFGFSNCPDICPATLQLLAAARSRLAVEGLPESELPGIVFISVDPERDRPEVLKSYVANFGPNIIGLTGDLSEIQKLTGQLGIFHAKSSAQHDGYNVDHSSAVLVIDPNAHFHALFSAPVNLDDLAHDLPLILAAK